MLEMEFEGGRWLVSNEARPVFLRQRVFEWSTHSEWGYLVSSRTAGSELTT